MSDDRSERLPSVSRRRLLALTGTATATGLAGCSILGSPDDDATGSPTATDSGSTRDEAVVPDSLYQGETIPPVPHDEIADSAPTVVAPASGVTNPVLTAADVTDFGNADYVADPFIFAEDGEWHMFFEVVNSNRNPDAAIGHATSDDGLEWSYNQTVLEKQNHTSYPFVRKWEGEYYMIPPTGRRIELWKANSFPGDWEKVGNLVEEDFYTKDPTFVRWNDRWWLFTDRDNRDVMVYHSETLDPEGWEPHAANPVVSDRLKAARQGGRPVVMDDSLYLFFQDVEYEYGDEVRSYEVTELTTESYSDQETANSPVLAGVGSGWNGKKMHHFDAWSLGEGNGWRCAVDGATAGDTEWSIGIYDAPPSLGIDTDSVPYDNEQVSGFYRLDKDNNVAVDHSGKQNHGVIRGTTETTAGNCTALDFSEDRDVVSFPDPYADALDGEEFSLVVRGTVPEGAGPQTLWAYTSLHVGRRLAARWDGDDGGWVFSLSGTGDRVQADVGSSLESGDAFQLTLTYTAGDGFAIFENGTRLTQVRDVGSVYHEVCFLTLGGTLPGQYPWMGTTNTVGVFQTALSSEELTQLDDDLC